MEIFSLQNVAYWPLANLVFTTTCELGIMISVLTENRWAENLLVLSYISPGAEAPHRLL